MDFHGFHGSVSFSRMTPNFTENVTAVKSRIRSVPTHCYKSLQIRNKLTHFPEMDRILWLLLSWTAYSITPVFNFFKI